MISYRGRELNINDKYLRDYEDYTGEGLTASRIDLYVYSKYIKDKSKENDIPQIVVKLSDAEIIDEVERKLRYEIGFYTGNREKKNV